MLSVIIKFKQFLGRCYDKFKLALLWTLFKVFSKKPKVYTDIETLKLIINNELSVSRYGDGEFRLMSNRGEIGFQSSNPKLSEKLLSSFGTRNNKLLICSFNFKKRRPMNTDSGNWLKKFVVKHYKHFNFFDFDYKYGDTDFTRFYQPDCYKKVNYEFLELEYIPLLRQVWNNKSLLIVEGEETKLGVGNDLFNNAKSIRRIICPSKNAFDRYTLILRSVLKHKKESELVLIALGPTASVLSVDLCTNYNVRAIDIGHVDIVYTWFLNRAKEKTKVFGKFVNEVPDTSNKIIYVKEDSSWKNEIVDRL